MKKKLSPIIPLILTVLLMVTACSSKGEDNNSTGGNSTEKNRGVWKSTVNLKETISIDSYEQDAVLGDLEKYGIMAEVPKGAFTNGTRLIISKPEKSLNYDKEKLNPKGSPYSFRIEGNEGRSNFPIIIKIAVDKDELVSLQEHEGYKGVHFSEETGWTYIDPIEVNKDMGYVAFNIYYNPLWGTAELTEEERKEEYIKSKALTTWGEQRLKDEVESVTREMIQNIMVTQFNASNKSEVGLIADAVLKEMKYGTLEYGKIQDSLRKGDINTLTSDVSTILGKTLALNMKNDTLGTVFGQTGNIVAAASHLWEGDYSGAGMAIAEAIADNSVVYKAAKVWIDVVDTKINNWKNDEIEEAYQAYKNGSEDFKWFGYSVDKGDFEELWNQMRGVSRQIEIDAVKKYADSIGVDPNSLSEEQINNAKQKAKKLLKSQFEDRITQEDEIKKAEENEREIIKQFETWNLLKKGSSWYPYDSSIEQILERMHNQIKRIQEETGRFNLVYKDGDLHDQSRGLDNIGKIKGDEMLVSHLAELINIRYVLGEDEYLKKLNEYGYAPEVKLEAGTYTGTIIITAAPIIEYAKKGLNDPASIPEIKDENGEKCEEIDFDSAEFQAQLKEAVGKAENVIGKEIPLTILISNGVTAKDFKASIKIDYASIFPDYGCEDMSNAQEFSVKSENSKITFTHAAEEDSMETFEGTISLNGVLKGNYSVTTTQAQYSDLTGKNVMISGSWSTKKTK